MKSIRANVPVIIYSRIGRNHYKKHTGGKYNMLRWIIILLVIALIAAVLGFGGIAGAAAGVAEIIFYIFIALVVLSVILGLVRGF